MIRQVEAKAAVEPDALAIFMAVMTMAIGSEADPYLLIGAMLEGVATTLNERIPAHRREEVAEAIRELLSDLMEDREAS